jgi:hypothetical protein
MAGESRNPIRRWDEVGPEYEQRRWRRQSYRGMKWEDIMPGYWYGHEMASNQHYRDRPWSDVETDLRTGYPAWAERHGYSDDGGGLWDRIKDGVREAWEAVTGQNRRTYEHQGDREVPTTEMDLEGQRV